MDSHCPHNLQLLQQRGEFGPLQAANHFAFRSGPFPHFPHPPFPLPPAALYGPRSPILPLLNQGAATRAPFVGGFIHQPATYPHNPRTREMRRQRPSKRARQRMKKRMHIEESQGESNRQASESGYETTGDCLTPKKIVPHSSGNNNDLTRAKKSLPIWNKASDIKQPDISINTESFTLPEAVDEKPHSRPDSASSYTSLNVSDTSLKKLLKDLHRCSVSITRYQAMLLKHCDDGMEKLLHVFSSLRKNLNNREADLVQELNTIKESASTILQRRKDTATYLRQAAEQCQTLEDVQVTELKQQIKQFVTDRKVDEEIGTITRFQADKDDLLPYIMGFGKVNNVRHLYTEWEENPAEVIEISKHRSFFPSVGKCSSLSSNSQESISNEETVGCDSAFIESSNTSLEIETTNGLLDSTVNSPTKTESVNETQNDGSHSSKDTHPEMKQNELRNNESSSNDEKFSAPSSLPQPAVTTISTSKDHRTSTSKSNSQSTAAKNDSSKTEHQTLPRTPRKSPKSLKSSSTVVVVVGSNSKSKEGKRNQPSSSLSKKGDKKRPPLTVDHNEKIGKENSSPSLPAGCEKDMMFTQEMKDDASRKYSASELRQIQQRVRDSLRQQGVYLYDPITGDGPPKSAPNAYNQPRPEGAKDNVEPSSNSLIRKKKTPTQLRRERKKRQKERERRQREMEKKAQAEAEITKNMSSEVAQAKNTTSKHLSHSHSNHRKSCDLEPTQTESKTENTCLDNNLVEQQVENLEDHQDSTESCFVSSDSSVHSNSENSPIQFLLQDDETPPRRNSEQLESQGLNIEVSTSSESGSTNESTAALKETENCLRDDTSAEEQPNDFVANSELSDAQSENDTQPDTANTLPHVTDTLTQPDTSDTLVDTADTQPDTSDKQPDASDTLVDTADTQPDTSDKQPDASGTLVDTADTQPDTSDKQPDASGTLVDTTDTQPDASGTQADTADTQNTDTADTLPDATDTLPEIADIQTEQLDTVDAELVNDSQPVTDTQHVSTCQAILADTKDKDTEIYVAEEPVPDIQPEITSETTGQIPDSQQTISAELQSNANVDETMTTEIHKTEDKAEDKADDKAEDKVAEDKAEDKADDADSDTPNDSMAVSEDRVLLTHTTEEACTSTLIQENIAPTESSDSEIEMELPREDASSATQQIDTIVDIGHVASKEATPPTSSLLGTPSNNTDPSIDQTNEHLITDNEADSLRDKQNGGNVGTDKELPECANRVNCTTTLTDIMDTNSVAMATVQKELESGFQNKPDIGLRHEE